MMKAQSLLITTLLIVSCFSVFAQDVVINNHFDVIQQLGSIRSKSRQLIVSGNRNMQPAQLDSLRMMYFDLKATHDGVISKYKSMIDNPALARKTGESITGDINETIRQLNDMSKYYMLNSRSTGSMGFKPIGAFALITGVVSLGKELYSEIRSMQLSRRTANKNEVDEYVLPDYDEVK